MKKIRLIENFLEFVSLCVATFFLVKYVGKDVASHDGIVIVVLLFGCAAFFCVNFLLQTLSLLNSSKIGYHYFLAKTKLFTILLIIPVILCTLVIRDGFFLFLAFFAAVLIPYIGIITLLFFLDSLLLAESFEVWVSQKRNKIFLCFLGICIVLTVITIDFRWFDQ